MRRDVPLIAQRSFKPTAVATGLVSRSRRAFKIEVEVAFAQPPGQVCLRFPHGTVDGSIVVFTLVSFVIAAQINPDEPSAVASCDDLANFCEP